MASQLTYCFIRTVVQVLMGLFLQCFSHPTCQDDSCQNCEKLPEFVNVTAKILSVLYSGHGVFPVWNKTNVRQIGTLYFWFQFRPYQRSRHVILHQSAKFYPNKTARGRKMTSCPFSRWRISAILNFRGPMVVNANTIALNCLVFEKIAFLCTHFWRRVDKRTN